MGGEYALVSDWIYVVFTDVVHDIRILFAFKEMDICQRIFTNGGVILLFVLSYVMPNMQFMQISVAVHYSAYFGLGILYCIYKGRIDAILLRYKYGMFLGSFALSASLLPWKLVAALVGIVFSLILSLIVEKRSGVGLIHLSDYTYTVFLLSYFPQMLVRGPIAHAFPEVNQYLFSCVSFVLGFSLPILWRDIS